MLDFLSDPAVWLSFATLSLLEIILGIDNIIFISIVAERLPEDRRQPARLIGLALALLMRVALLFSLTWVIRLTAPVLTVAGHGFSWRDIILFSGGLFLLTKATIEIYDTVEGKEKAAGPGTVLGGFADGGPDHPARHGVLVDSILTAIGLTEYGPRARRLLAVAFHRVVDLDGGLGQQEQATEEQDDVAPREAVAGLVGARRRQPDHPGEREQKSHAHEEREARGRSGAPAGGGPRAGARRRSR